MKIVDTRTIRRVYYTVTGGQGGGTATAKVIAICPSDYTVGRPKRVAVRRLFRRGFIIYHGAAPNTCPFNRSFLFAFNLKVTADVGFAF